MFHLHFNAFFVHEFLKWFTAGPRMHARTLAFYVGGAMPALAAVARLPGMHVCFSARIMTGLVHFGPANRLSGPVVSRHPTAHYYRMDLLSRAVTAFSPGYRAGTTIPGLKVHL